MVNEAQLRQILPACPDCAGWLPHLLTTFQRFEVKVPQRQAAYLAQVGHESGQLRRLSENLNYSAAGLRATWPSRFPDDATASRYARQKEAIANRVYAGRLGNGDEASGDGWRYRGRGLIQLTGRSNYAEAGEALGLPLEAQPELLETPAIAAAVSGWFWQSRGLNPLADHAPGANDDDDFRRITKIINGGLKGLEERRAIWQRARAVFGV